MIRLKVLFILKSNASRGITCRCWSFQFPTSCANKNGSPGQTQTIIHWKYRKIFTLFYKVQMGGNLNIKIQNQLQSFQTTYFAEQNTLLTDRMGKIGGGFNLFRSDYDKLS